MTQGSVAPLQLVGKTRLRTAVRPLIGVGCPVGSARDDGPRMPYSALLRRSNDGIRQWMYL